MQYRDRERCHGRIVDHLRDTRPHILHVDGCGAAVAWVLLAGEVCTQEPDLDILELMAERDARAGAINPVVLRIILEILPYILPILLSFLV